MLDFDKSQIYAGQDTIEQSGDLDVPNSPLSIVGIRWRPPQSLLLVGLWAATCKVFLLFRIHELLEWRVSLPDPEVTVAHVPSKGRRVVIKRVVAAFLVIILLVPALVLYYREMTRPVLRFDSRSDAIDIKTSEKIWVDEANNIHDEKSAAGRVILNIHGGGDFTLERVEISINETALDIAYVAIANGPLPPADSIAPHYSETTVVMPVTVTLPAYVAIHVDSKRAIFGDYMKVHVVGTWISLGFRERVDLNAETELNTIFLP